MRSRPASLYASYQTKPAMAQADNGPRILVDGPRVAQRIAAEMDNPRALPQLAGAIAKALPAAAFDATFATLGELDPANQPRCLADLRRELIAAGTIPRGVSACASAARPIAFLTGTR